MRLPNKGRSVFAVASVRILNTVAQVVTIVHSCIVTPDSSQLVPSVCLTLAARTLSHASLTEDSSACATRCSMLLMAPSESSTPSSSFAAR
jgi:hypothetical protein